MQNLCTLFGSIGAQSIHRELKPNGSDDYSVVICRLRDRSIPLRALHQIDSITIVGDSFAYVIASY